MNDPSSFSRRQLLRGKLFGRLVDAAAKRVDEAEGAIARAMPTHKPDGTSTPPSVAGRTARTVSVPVQRPPGAIDEAAFLNGCTRCGECIVACPVHAIVIAPTTFFEASGTPMIDPHGRACVMCADTPCITACGPGVLRKDRPLKMGTAHVQAFNCLAYTGAICTACSEACPVEGAITLSEGRPTIVEEKCTGCGVCHSVCPAPSTAVIVLPLADRAP